MIWAFRARIPDGNPEPLGFLKTAWGYVSCHNCPTFSQTPVWSRVHVPIEWLLGISVLVFLVQVPATWKIIRCSDRERLRMWD